MSTFMERVMSRGNSRTIGDERSSYRIHSKDYKNTSGDINAVQIKPNISVGGTTGMTGIEVSPRFADGIAGSKLVAIKADPQCKGTTGNLTDGMIAVECNIDAGDPTASRTFGGDIAALSAFLDLPSGCVHTAGLNTLLKVRSVNAAKWDAFLNLDDANTGINDSGDIDGGTATYYLVVYIGTTKYGIQLYTI